MGKPDDIASVVAFLAGPDGGWVSGGIIEAAVSPHGTRADDQDVGVYSSVTQNIGQ